MTTQRAVCRLGFLIVVSACAARTQFGRGAEPRVGPLSVMGSAAFDAQGETLRVIMTVRNDGSTDAPLIYGACALSVSFFRGDQEMGKPDWDQEGWQPFSPRQMPWLGRVCLSYAVETTLKRGGAGSAPEFSAKFTAGQVLGDSLPPGLYTLRARLAFNDTTVALTLGTVPLRR